MKGRYRHNLLGRIISPPKAEIEKNIPEKKNLNLMPGMVYELEIVHSFSYDLTNRQGRNKVKKKMKFIDETEHLYIFEHLSGLTECFSKLTPEKELKINPTPQNRVNKKQDKIKKFTNELLNIAN